jgi:hypothetical protein
VRYCEDTLYRLAGKLFCIANRAMFNMRWDSMRKRIERRLIIRDEAFIFLPHI